MHQDLSIDLSSLYRKRTAESRSISAENPTGQPGGGGRATDQTTLHPASAHCARDLGPGWKLSPCRTVEAGETVVLMDYEGPGVIRHMWFTLDPKFYRDLILRIYWDGLDHPSVECPIGDLFCSSWNEAQRILAQPINVNPKGGLNIFLPMPFQKHALITVENQSPEKLGALFYTINFTLEPVGAEALAFHAQWRRTNPLPFGEDYTMIDGVEGQGHYVGAFMAWQQNNKGWWGEGEIKMYLDDDEAFPTICGTGTEDYFGGAWCFRGDFSAPFMGYQIVTGEEDQPGTRITLYRFHVHDPVFFKRRMRVTMQALGWRDGQRFLPLQDDIASVVYWYQTLPHAPFPPLPDRDFREIV